MIKYIIRTTLERTFHSSLFQIDYELLVDKDHRIREIFTDQLVSIMDNDVVLLEDDVILCRNFKERIEGIISLHPNEMINFFSYPNIYFLSDYKLFISNQCTYYPKEILRNIVKCLSNFKYRKVYTPEEYIQFYLGGKRVYNPRPCLVQHIDKKSILDKHPVPVPRRTPYFIDYLEDLGIPYEEADRPENKQKLIEYMNKQFEGIDGK